MPYEEKQSKKIAQQKWEAITIFLPKYYLSAVAENFSIYLNINLYIILIRINSYSVSIKYFKPFKNYLIGTLS